MRKSKFTEIPIVWILKKAEDRMAIAQVARKNGINASTFCAWRYKYGDMAASNMQRLRELERENTQLKRLVTKSVTRYRNQFDRANTGRWTSSTIVRPMAVRTGPST